MSAKIYYLHDHSHSCDCGGWAHEAVDCDLPPESPCPMCEMEEGLLPMSNGSKLGLNWVEGEAEPHVSLVGSEEVYS